MKRSKKLWSLLLALIMVMSLFGGISLTGAAAGETTITPDSPVNGETLTMTATGVGELITVFDLASIGYGTGLEYCLWFDHDGTFSFDKDVTLTYQGSPKEELEAGVVYKIADGVSGGSWSELYVSLDDGNMLMILDSDAPGNFASLAADTPLSEFPGAINGEGGHPLEVKAPEKVEYPDPEGIVKTAKKNADGSITLAFSSDVHQTAGNLNLADWIGNSGIDYIDTIGFCGDLGAATASTTDLYWTYVGEVMNYVDSEISAGKIGSAVYTHGNHEWFPASGGGYKTQFSKYPEITGRIKQLGEAVRTDDYIVYCFGAGEGAANYSCHYTPEDAAAMGEYLSTAPTDIPIFVLTHYPLHTWIRGSSVRVTNYAGDVIDVLNEHPNVVLLWGHNHSEYDDNYYEPKFAGDEVVIDASGTTKTINFSYLAAGCTSDTEYTGATGGSASIMNKGLVVTIQPDGGLNYKYVTLDGKFMSIESPWLVRFRDTMNNVNHVFDTQYVENGKTAAAVTAPSIEGYEFTGWATWLNGEEVEYSFSTPITRNMLITAKYAKVIQPVAAPEGANLVTVTPDATAGGASLTMTGAGVGDLFTAFDLASIGYGTGIEYGFWFDADGLVSFNQDVTLYYQGAATNVSLKAGEIYSVAGFGEYYVPLDDGSMLLLLETEAPGNFASLPGDQPFSAFPGTIGTASIAAEPAPAPAEPAPAPAEPAPAPAAPAEPAPVGQSYTVRAGDSLWRIARQFYGSGAKWDVIYRANAGIIRNPNLIYVGQVLQIP